jgi:hypothetical protein
MVGGSSQKPPTICLLNDFALPAISRINGKERKTFFPNPVLAPVWNPKRNGTYKVNSHINRI